VTGTTIEAMAIRAGMVMARKRGRPKVGAADFEEMPMRPPPKTKVILRVKMPGAARYRSPKGTVHRGRLYASETDCGLTIGKGWESADKNEAVTCGNCHR
jgi:hypothetical protein